MILGNLDSDETAMTASAGGPTLDDLFARALARDPDATALVDARSRGDTSGRPAQRLTYAQADRIVSATAGRLQGLGLKTDHIVALHMPNTVEAVLTLLGVLRAGMIAAPMPLLWRRAEAVAALSRIGAKAIIAFGAVGETDLAELATSVAAEVFQIRGVCAFGSNLPDGVVPFDPLLATDQVEPVVPVTRARDPAAHVAVVTWDTDAAGPLPVARSHAELCAAGLALALESAIGPGATILSTVQPSSLAGLASGLIPWLGVGGTLCLHRPFDSELLREQIAAEDPDVLTIPGPLVPCLAETGLFAEAPALQSVVAVWRAPERLAASAEWHDRKVGLVDLQVFGEIGLLAARRGVSGRPAPIGIGTVYAPRGAGGTPVAEIARTASGTLALRGPMTPRFCYPPGAERGDPPFLRLDEAFFIDTGQPCRVDQETHGVVVTAPPRGIVGIGGYRVPIGVFRRIIEEIDADATIAALPDMLTGQRLAASSVNDDALRQALARRGVNPLVVGAFLARRAAEPPGVEDVEDVPEPRQRRAG